MSNRIVDIRIMQVVHINISQAKRIAIELKKISEQRSELQDLISKSRRFLNFHIEGEDPEVDIIGQLFDYMKLDETARSLSTQLSLCVSSAASYLCEIVNDNVQKQSDCFNLISEFMQIKLIVLNTVRLGVDYSSLMPGLCKAHILLSDYKVIANYSSLSSLIFDIVKEL